MRSSKQLEVCTTQKLLKSFSISLIYAVLFYCSIYQLEAQSPVKSNFTEVNLEVTDVDDIYAFDIADINKDGAKELIITFNNAGHGTIGEAIFNSSNSCSVYSDHIAGDTYLTEFRNGLLTSDFTKDNSLDIIGANGGSTLNIYTKNDQEWELLPGHVIGSYGNNFELGDFNHDTYPEILTNAANTNIVSYLDSHSGWPMTYSLNEENSSWQEWVDVDNNGIDEIFTIYRQDYSDISEQIIYRYDSISDTFITLDLNLNIDFSNVETFTFYDYDQDGDKDLLTLPPVGSEGYSLETHLYINDGSFNFSFYKSFPSANRAIWHDLDNDGWADLILESSPPKENPTFTILYVTKVFFQRGLNEFVESDLESKAYDWRSELKLSDYDNDGDTDIFFQYEKESFSQGIRVCINDWADLGNTTSAPTVPDNLSNHSIGNFANELSWNSSSDDKCGQYGIYYNVAIKKDDEYVLAPSADVSTGKQFKTFTSNVGSHTTLPVNCLSDGTYQWAVQAIDNSGKASSFSDFQEFTITGRNPSSPINLSAETLSDKIISLSWDSTSDNETEYVIEKRTPNQDQFFVLKMIPANQTVYTDTTFEGASTLIEYRVKAVNCASESEYSNTVLAETFPMHFSQNSKFILSQAKGRAANLGDYNNDSFLDLLINYRDEITRDYKVELYKNVQGQFIPSGIFFENNELSQLEWIDYNNDGQLDIFMVSDSYWDKTISVYQNNGDNGFEQIQLDSLFEGFENVDDLFWINLNNDQKRQLIFSASSEFASNNRNIFILSFNQDNSVGIKEIMQGVKLLTSPTDLNNDGFLDFPVLNTALTQNNLGYLMNKDNLTFEYISMNSGLTNFQKTIIFAPLNEDTYLDAVLMGPYYEENQYGQSIILSNNQGEFIEKTNTNLLQSNQNEASIAFGDFYNDGSTDLITMGYFELSPTQSHDGTVLYHNIGDYHFEQTFGLFESETQHGQVVTGDIDNDGDLDIIHLGEYNYTSPRIVLFENTIVDGWGISNAAPLPPTSLTNQTKGNSVILSWNNGSDDLTSVDQLSYNVALIKDDSDTILFPLSHSNGIRKVVGLGNANLNLQLKIDSLEMGNYKWLVQSIDGTFQGSEFSNSQEFEIVETNVLNSQVSDKITIYPSPAADDVNIEVNQSIGEIIIQDLLGRTITSRKFESSANKTVQLNIKTLNKGLYIVMLKNEFGELIGTNKLIKE
ncbi:FG-GAP-like repeat-containing protein [Marinoscillum pacificum]|uniref:FG-GAP-like repeat-containing protein n=1 Tax=Marinoscillum pacificum TaxID=392723 RepID=UPI0021579FC6|nr:FG-GAP-like repeat-containing protein [Marinoscillum pacificum]